MALGGGSYMSQDKILPGTYINFVSVASASSVLSDRGIATMPLELDWERKEKYLRFLMKTSRKTVRKFSDMLMTMRK